MRNPKITTRAATERDVPSIMALLRALAEHERMTRQLIATEERLRISLFRTPPDAHCVIAWSEEADREEAVGLAFWYQNYSTFLARPGLYLEDLFVLPKWRDRRVGRALVAHLANIAVEHGWNRMEWLVSDGNEAAIGFYNHVGAVALDQFTTYRLAGDPLNLLAAGANSNRTTC